MSMKSNKIYLFFLILLSVLLVSAEHFAEGEKSENNSLKKIQGSPSRTYMNINNVSTLIYNDGNSDIDPSGNSGAVFPKGSGKAAVFESGLLWGARIEGDPQVRVGGSAYRQGLQPGKILQDGTPEDPELDKNRIYRVRPDIYPGGPFVDLSGEAIDEGSSADAIRAQYELDWVEWPVTDGAEYDDVDGDGTYNSAVDVPGVPGADQTIWFVANDLDPTITTFLYGAQPLGVEMQATFWAYAQTGALGNTFFRKYKLINKSQTDFLDMYLSMWSDVDLGNSTDDFAGSDTTLSLGYCYNAQANDATYNPLPPPAVGFDFFQGPVLDGVPGEDRNKNGIDDAIDNAIFDGKNVGPGKINLPMTAFYYFARGDATVVDPTQGDPQGSTQFYNFFQGKVGLTGDQFVNPNTGEPTSFALPGDPQTRTGWIDGQQLGGGDRRIGSASGPFTMAVGDTQEVVVAEIFAGAIEGVDRISAIGLLKFYDAQAQLAYDNFFDLPVPPKAPEVTSLELENEIVLNWATNFDRVNETESNDEKGFKFQGYNVYQLPSTSADISAGVRIATFDISDGIGKIKDDVFDTKTGEVVNVPVQFGNDTGIKRFLNITTDELSGGTPLINGIRYYFAVTSYSYNPNDVVPNNLENPLQVFTVVPNNANPGDILPSASGDIADAVQVSGTGNAAVQYKVIDPTALTGDEYEVFFNEKMFLRDVNAQWQEVTNALPKVLDLTGSTIDMAGVFGGQPGTVEINMLLNDNSPNGAWIDGVVLTFPEGVNIISAPDFEAGGGTITPEIVGQVINMGLINDELTQDGIFHGGEQWTVTVEAFTPPLLVSYLLKDDGWEAAQVDVQADAEINEIGNVSVTQQYWNLRNVNSGVTLLSAQSIFGGTDIYADPSGPGGSAGPLGANAGDNAVPIVEGIQVSVSGSFAAPITFLDAQLTTDADPSDGDLTLWGDLTLFGDPSGFWFEEGSTTTVPSIETAQPDLEFRFTGVSDGNDAVVTEGGQWTTSWDRGAFGANDMTGFTSAQIRLPFEVWDIESNIQLEAVVINRNADGASPNGDNVITDGSARWRITGRDYIVILYKEYTDDQNLVRALNDESATWCVFFNQNGDAVWSPGDVFTISYANPLQLGIDSFTFTTSAPGYDMDQAKDDIKDVNVFPNPYYAVNSEEINKYNRFVTFSHLPDQATIRIFNIAGVHVKTIEKDDNSQFQRWDLANTSGLPVASGLYIAYIDMPGIGETKILKVAIIQEQQILDRF
jgi:hypothetical protein